MTVPVHEDPDRKVTDDLPRRSGSCDNPTGRVPTFDPVGWVVLPKSGRCPPGSVMTTKGGTESHCKDWSGWLYLFGWFLILAKFYIVIIYYKI